MSELTQNNRYFRDLNGLESQILDDFPLDFMFRERVQKDFENGFFHELFGEEVQPVNFISVGDRHYGIEIEDYRVTLSDEPHHKIVGKVEAKLVYPHWNFGKISKKVCPVNSDILDDEVILASPDQVGGSRVDDVGRKIICDRIVHGNLVTDSTKQVVFKKEDGETCSLIYKPYSTVKLEEMVGSFMVQEGFFHPTIMSRTDAFGVYGWIEFVNGSSRLTKASVKNWNSKQLSLFNNYQIFSYLLGAYDFHNENIMEVSGDPNSLTRIDYEDSLLGSNDHFEEFIKWQHLGFPPKDMLFYAIQSLDLYWKDFRKAIDNFKKSDILEKMDEFVIGLSNGKNLHRRKILRATALGGVNDASDQTIIPHYSEQIGSCHVDSYFRRRKFFEEFRIDCMDEIRSSSGYLRLLLK